MSDDTDAAEIEADACTALTHAINAACTGNEVGTVLWALTIVGATVIRAVAPGDLETQAGLFAAVANNMHAGLDQSESEAVALVVGDASTLTPDQAKAATSLCPMFSSLILGLAEHRDPRDVLNAWSSTLLMALLDNGAERARAILQGMLDGLPSVEAQREQHAAMAARVNTGQVGRA